MVLFGQLEAQSVGRGEPHQAGGPVAIVEPLDDPVGVTSEARELQTLDGFRLRIKQFLNALTKVVLLGWYDPAP